MAAKTNGKKQSKKRKNKKNINVNKVKTMKLAVMMLIILLAFAGLGTRLYVIAHDNKNDYQKKILSQQRYDSLTLPYTVSYTHLTLPTILRV